MLFRPQLLELNLCSHLATAMRCSALLIPLVALISAVVAQSNPVRSQLGKRNANDPVTVNLQILALGKPLFNGLVSTRGHDITTASSGGSHHCDGTNFGQHCAPGATTTTALADAAKAHRFTFDASFDTEFDDFFITRIGAFTGNDTFFWLVFLNGVETSVGGCQQQVTDGDHVLWTFTDTPDDDIVQVTGPPFARINQPAVFTVVDPSGSPLSGVAVNGDGVSGTTDVHGEVSLTFVSPGVRTLTATSKDTSSVFSNNMVITVRS